MMQQFHFWYTPKISKSRCSKRYLYSHAHSSIIQDNQKVEAIHQQKNEQTQCSTYMGFPGSSAGKDSACKAGDTGSIPGLGRFPGEGIGYPLQYSWASLVAQMVRNPPAMQETGVWPLDREDPLEAGMATHPSVLPWRIPRTEEPGGL